MNKKLLITQCLFCTSLSVLQAIEKKPNIIFILADDLGYGDVKVFNPDGKIETPHLDRLASNGVMFTDAHSSSAVSTPTRYGILTGRYNWRSSLKKGVLSPYSKPLIPPERTTMASMLKEKGYRTACIGKWHLGMNFPVLEDESPMDSKDGYNLDFTKPITGGPLSIGFDYFFGVDCPNFPPYCFIEEKYTQEIPTLFYPVDQQLDCRQGRGAVDWRLEEVLPMLKDKALEFIIESQNNDEPFFLYLPLTSPHTPIVPSDNFKDKSGLNIYADFVMQTDAVVGEIVIKLQEKGILDNTLIVFTSDNGCSPRADFPELERMGHSPGYIFRGAKADIYEAGHRIPCIVHWPEKASKGIVHQTICLNDFMATFAAIADYKFQDNEAEDSFNILPLIKYPDNPNIIREATVHHSVDGSFAIRQGKWKLILTNTSGGWSEPLKPSQGSPEYQLYNLEEDTSEVNNIIELYPEIKHALEKLLLQYIREGRSTPGTPQSNDVFPWEQIEPILSQDII